MTTQTQGTSRSRVSSWAIAAPAVLIALGVGIYLFGEQVQDYTTSVGLTAAWILVVGVGAWLVGRRLPHLKAPLLTTFVGAAVVSGAGFYWTSVRDKTVNETVVTGAPVTGAATPGQAPAAVTGNIQVARGAFQTRAHDTTGTATIVKLAAGGRKLTLTDFKTDNGPDVRVYLVKGPVDSDADVKTYVDLGGLKGNIGNQQYTVPDDVDLATYSTVVLWCRAFTVSFAQADLLTT